MAKQGEESNTEKIFNEIDLERRHGGKKNSKELYLQPVPIRDKSSQNPRRQSQHKMQGRPLRNAKFL